MDGKWIKYPNYLNNIFTNFLHGLKMCVDNSPMGFGGNI